MLTSERKAERELALLGATAECAVMDIAEQIDTLDRDVRQFTKDWDAWKRHFWRIPLLRSKVLRIMKPQHWRQRQHIGAPIASILVGSSEND